MNSYNRIEFKGIIGKDATIRDFNGNSVAEFSVATNYSTKRKDGTYADETTWLNLVVWSGAGVPELSAFKKGTRVSGVGRLRCRQYTDAQGVKKERWEVVATDVDIIMSEAPKPQAQAKSQAQSSYPAPPSQTATPPRYMTPANQEEDLPF